MLAAGEIALEPNHHHAAVGPMAGTITRNMWVWVVENKAFGNRAFCRQVESFQQFGDYSRDALGLLEQWRDVWGPALRAAVLRMGGIPLKQLVARALAMGDEMHNRVVASSSLFANAVAPVLVQCGLPQEQVVVHPVLRRQPPLPVPGIVHGRGEGLGGPGPGGGGQHRGHRHGPQRHRFRHPGERARRRVVHGPGPARAGPAAARVERGGRRAGHGRFRHHRDRRAGAASSSAARRASSASPAARAEQALAFSRDMRTITVGQSPDYLMPALDFAGAALAIDIRKVVRANLVPVIDTAIAHREPGHGIIGGGIVRPPQECFTKALARFAEKYQA